MDFPSFILDRMAETPLYHQLAGALAAAIDRGELQVGARLPAERDLAACLGVSRTTVVGAYHELEARGLVRGHVGRGTFVCAGIEPPEAPFAWRGKLARGMERVADSAMGDLMRSTLTPGVISFAAGVPALERFPADRFAEVTDEVLRRQAGAVYGLGPSEGQPRLRRAIAARFGVRPEQVLVLSGAQQGIDLITRCLVDPGDTVVMDRPGYVGAIHAFRAAGARVVGWDVGRADLDELEDLLLRYRPKLMYTTPTFQSPTGAVFSLPVRQGLLELAARYRLPVVEDATYRELYFDTPPPPSLCQLDRRDIVIHLSTFSKMLAPGLRLGWLVASPAITEHLAAVKQRSDLHTANLLQLVVAELVTGGLLDEHLRGLRAEHARRMEALIAALDAVLPPGTLTHNRPGGGLYLWCRLRGRVEARALLRHALAEGVAFANGEVFYPDDAGRHELRLCFSSQPPVRLAEGAQRFARAFASLSPDQPRPAPSLVPLV